MRRSHHFFETPLEDDGVALSSPYEMRDCPGGCGRVHLLTEGSLCPWCGPPNPFGSGPLAVFIDAGGEDSPLLSRIADGSAGWNAGLPPIDNGDGTSRPVTNHELRNNRGVREYAKRNGLEPLTTGRYRGLR